MTTSRPLREVLSEDAQRLADDPRATLDEAGHPDLPDSLVAEAVVSYADTAPHQVAEHLAPFVTAHHAARHGEPPAEEAALSHGLELLSTAPAAADAGAPGGDNLEAELTAAEDVDFDRAPHHTHPELDDAGAPVSPPAGAEPGDPPGALSFGSGAAADAAPEAGEAAADGEEPPAPPAAGPDDGELPTVAEDDPFFGTLDEQAVDRTDPAGEDPLGL